MTLVAAAGVKSKPDSSNLAGRSGENTPIESKGKFKAPPAPAPYRKFPVMTEQERRRAEEALFDKFVAPEPNSGCWLWLGTIGSKGYGDVQIKGRSFRAHRAFYFLRHGVVPEQFCCHRCDVRLCVNPDHIF